MRFVKVCIENGSASLHQILPLKGTTIIHYKTTTLMTYKKNYNQPISALLIICIFVFSGCATLFKGSTNEVAFDSKPPAKIYIDGELRGEAPLKLNLKSDEDYDIEFRKDGYETKMFHLDNELGVKWIVLDILGGFVPILIDAATGDWKELKEDRVFYNLEEQK